MRRRGGYLRALVDEALRGLRARRGRMLLSGVGVALAAAMLATATTVGYGLGTGFGRSAKAADLPDIIARFDPQSARRVTARIGALPDVAGFTLRDELTNTRLIARGHSARDGVIEVMGPGRRGYAIVAGRDLSSRPGEVVVEQGLAGSWGLRVGDTLGTGGLALRIVGLAEAPDDVAYPLAAPRVYVSRVTLAAAAQVQAGGRGSAQSPPAAVIQSLPPAIRQAIARRQALRARERAGIATGATVDMAEIWLRDSSQLDTVLEQARSTAYGLQDLRLETRTGVRLLIDQAAGIVIALLAALSVMALGTAGVMLAAAARAEVQRRLPAIGLRRSVGATRGHVTAVQALEAALVAAPAAALGVLAGTLAALGASNRLLELLNELPPGVALVGPLIACWALAVAIPVLTAAWPAWRAGGRPPIELLRGAELRGGARRRARRSWPIGRGLPGLGARLVAARRVRLATTLALLGVSAGFVLLMLALASELTTLENDPAALGKRYQLSASLPPSDTGQVRALPGVSAAAPRYELTALDSFELGETIDVIAYPGRHTTFEAPPLVSGRRLQGEHETEVGNGLAQVLGLEVGSILALQLPNGQEVRFRVSGIVNSLDHDGHVAYVPAGALVAADPGAPEQIAVLLKPGSSTDAVSRELLGLGAAPSTTGGVTERGQTLISALVAILRSVAVVDGLVCLYTLAQALALTAQERRRTIAVVRATGAGPGSVRSLLAGGALAVAVPAAIIGILLERLALGPIMANLAAGYASLPLGAGAGAIAVVLAGMALLSAGAVTWVARQTQREPISSALPR